MNIAGLAEGTPLVPRNTDDSTQVLIQARTTASTLVLKELLAVGTDPISWRVGCDLGVPSSVISAGRKRLEVRPLDENMKLRPSGKELHSSTPNALNVLTQPTRTIISGAGSFVKLLPGDLNFVSTNPGCFRKVRTMKTSVRPTFQFSLSLLIDPPYTIHVFTTGASRRRCYLRVRMDLMSRRSHFNLKCNDSYHPLALSQVSSTDRWPDRQRA